MASCRQSVKNNAVLSCRHLTVRPEGAPTGQTILNDVSAAFRPQSMNAVIGPSGCGKSMLMKAMLGLVPMAEGGEVWLGDLRVRRPEDLLGRVGFAPQFSIAQPKLTVAESLRYSLALTMADSTARAARLEQVLGVVGLGPQRDTRVESLSGGQLRRLGLGLELLTDPPALICDEVTSGLDPHSESAILDLLRTQCRDHAKTLLCIIHNLTKLDYFDWITVMNAGEVVFQGTLPELHIYFAIPDALHLYDALNSQPQAYWRQRWAEAPGNVSKSAENKVEASLTDTQAGQALPGALDQFQTLLRRRIHLLWRDHGSLSLLMGITFGFPLMVVIFALDGLPQISSPLLKPEGIDSVLAQVAYARESAQTAALVTSLIMFQVILLTLMGANNGAREIASERLLYEKERLNGLRPGVYAAAKLFFTGVVAAFQGIWMMIFVKLICVFPGPWDIQLGSLALVCVAMTWVCLAFSAWMNSAEKASSLSIYLVGFQLPLSGVVLALPAYLVWVFRPFINAYWGWSGYFKSMAEERLYDAYVSSHPSVVIPNAWVSLSVLGVHALIGATLVWWGCRRRKWNA